ncbi:hypothetical protein FEG63_07230 [Mycolicibacterium sphagni]|uniref:Secreted protein n=1 Tax=Mycolicibacterium sphagni TaxID=1786 RepID=A0ABX2JRD5_9MYCO|nr:hypothetical protein [Mycolicibacterium sphagni]
MPGRWWCYWSTFIYSCCSSGWTETSRKRPLQSGGAKEGRGYSAATATTATTRDAAQINCATLGERELEAGRHASHATQ